MSNAASDFADAVLHDHGAQQQQQQHAAAAARELHDGRTLSARPFGGSSIKPEAGPSQHAVFGNAPAPADAAWLARLLADALVAVPAAHAGALAAPGLFPASGLVPPQPGDDALSQISRLQSKLNQRLGPEYIAKRPGFGGGPPVPYLEGWKAIDLANEVFGFNGWSSSIVSLETDFCDVDEQGRVKIGVSCIMRITLRDGTYHEDVGNGAMEGVKSKGQAFQKAKKEAATDALKRTIKSFGKLLGNCMYDKRYITTAGKMQAKHEEYSIADLKRAPDMAALRAANAERDKANAARAASAAAQPHTSTDTEMDDDSMPPPPAPARNAAASSSGSGNSSSGGMGARSHTTPAPGPAAKRAEEERQRRLQMAAQKKAELQAAAAARKNEEAAAAAAAASAQQQRPTTAQMLDEVDEHTLHGALDYVEDEGMFGSQDLAADSGESEAAAMALEMQMEEEARMRALHGPQFRRATTASTPVVINAASSSRTASGETTEADDSGIGLDDETASALRVKQEYVESRAREKAAMPPPKRAGSKGRFSAPAPPNGASSLSAAASRPGGSLAVRSSPRRASTTAPSPVLEVTAPGGAPRGLAYAQGRPVGHAYVGTLGAKRGAAEAHRQPLGNLPIDEHGATKRPRV